ncbi:hypothetical protein L226DRAFT_529388 [Lentinus tigrinus ALCF2SS1-7]|uniref:Uncharacterized protein n=1 Tax=Lentinus tigrinus ALCF2SS1-6 TaxID=1328759 RepID=A0A5C2SSW5_9APHY|nr:hypothetical protein L227DRAFT_569196 [Lentinus tigrinus ALCF2SS1-6]RPD80936.1 hypothetical protein L226DRAFT_529388 [Lentinus tigrinus ALCF2SS1-7]
MNTPPPPYYYATRSPPQSGPYYQHRQYHGGETTPLLGTSQAKPSGHDGTSWKTLIFLVVLVVLFMVQTLGYIPTMVDDISASEKREIHWQWQRERYDHRIEVARRKAQLAKLEQERWEASRNFEEQRKAYEQEREQWEHDRQEERKRWANEKQQWERERQEEERHRKEVERRRQGVHWNGPWKNRGCDGYGVQSYSANLLDIPGDLNWREVCEDMPIQIEGRWYDKPDKCEAHDHQHVWATWFVDTNESQCMTYWDRMEDKGCTPGRSGMRRFEARLMNLHNGDNWDKMCNTSPATIRGVHYDRPTICEDKNGRTGIFDYPDGRCW